MEKAPAKAQSGAPLPGGALGDAGGDAPPTVMMAMSGGVDSSVAALLLSEAGYAVTGATMKLFGADVVEPDCDSSCCSADDVEDARAVCRRLGVPHYTFNFGDLFGEAVIDRFCAAYLGGTTPNPCIDCNRFLKFDALQRRRRELGLGFVATGHYARRAWDGRAGRWQLLRARDAAKDQSYVLYHLTQDALAHMLFPLGDLTKPEVRELARARGFATAEKPESQDICFVPDGDYAAFVERRCGRAAAFEPGEIVDCAGKVLGEHAGLVHYTVGQRKGIGVAAPEPLYVFAKDAKANRLVVGTAAEVQVGEVAARDVNLIAVERIEAPRAVTVKTHYRQRPVAATVEQTGDDELRVVFDEPQRAAAPGQAVVIYDGDAVVGGGTIC
ncbi:tRNA 2-thiouridine(34) synthase MnmA [uncultured Adlercreutzia sp.]|uniref:tRNA 2-thiouridine(34) synthase MnmA n=1 Tax=uncultured Adlercreutzia sp. TaxID=875803 RepID=UPI002676BAEA|nr:tRNA 2-thiouridine(34) synthase MnmA [uncultured Adlercreutzia sp.]